MCNSGGGIQLCVACNATLSVGRNTHFMGECHVVSRKNISIGENCAISWDTQIMDTDMHKIKSEGRRSNPDKQVTVGDRVWICSGAKIAKGSSIQDDTVVAANALITKKIEQGNCVVTGMPIKILKSEITWEP